MKKKIFAFCSGLVALITGACGLLAIDITQDIDEVTIPGYDLPNAATVFPPTAVNINPEAELGAQQTGPTSAAYVKEITLYITNSGKSSSEDEDYFDFFQTISLYIVGTNSSNLPAKKIAWVKEVGPKAAALSFTVDDSIDILPYIQQGAKFYSDIGGIQMPTDDVSYAGTITVTVRI